ncbi:ABC transporter ATP-binding protein [Serratia marcescens]|uniref:ABC transporter ATP-binding protein n=1 Tax=Serratia marcescens TaxID=615 RepID=UPI000F7D786E|nr:ABC transporter ATP-binding protein [Serratia marcescens]RTF30423.1 ABC transporter ATP-binding protein [Serratia marcescens]RTF56745.1 ABC transporter ATP-binding protein [Serratia marcescens]RTG24854.1 ABC transporter ATP-binding protein [Serratia marcescens]RTG40168.1 ABC transporter ATP-binding protein [Serratia marcescens]RTG46200.1 ABC transporter ATP-binding protein [Serratia marcescens]
MIVFSSLQIRRGIRVLLDNATATVNPGQKVGLVGKNGCGKSTLLSLLKGEIAADGGSFTFPGNWALAWVNQETPALDVPAIEYVIDGDREFRQLEAELQAANDRNDGHAIATLHGKLDAIDAWTIRSRAASLLHGLGFSNEQLQSPVRDFSGGWRMRLNLAQALVCRSDLLLLDEPTNHLDIETIDWLEGFLKEFDGSIVFISHDRSFIRNMATRIVDLDRGKLVSWPGNYDLYLQSKEEALRVEELQNAEFDRKLAQEEVWIRQGIKARRTRNEGRVRALKALRVERSQRREVMGTAKMQVEEATRSGKIVFELEDVNYQVGEKVLVRGFSAQVQRGDKIALVGPNGCGKTTLLKLMLGQLKADSGRVHCGTKLEVAYFDQHRADLDPERTVMDNLAEGKQEVMVNGRPRHVLGYLQDFLFHPKRAMTPVKALSGGERNRLLLAKLFLKPSNLLILDEPTNDLDVETLELLEELIDGYQGTVLLVSHDRQFVDNSVTECWIFEGNSVINAFVGGYYDAHHQRATAKPIRQAAPSASKPAAEKKAEQPKKTAAKLSYNLLRELEQLPQRLEQLEAEIEALQAQMSDADFFTRPHSETQEVLTALADAEQALEQAFARWEELEAMKNG